MSNNFTLFQTKGAKIFLVAVYRTHSQFPQNAFWHYLSNHQTRRVLMRILVWLICLNADFSSIAKIQNKKHATFFLTYKSALIEFFSWTHSHRIEDSTQTHSTSQIGMQIVTMWMRKHTQMHIFILPQIQWRDNYYSLLNYDFSCNVFLSCTWLWTFYWDKSCMLHRPRWLYQFYAQS